MSPLRDLAMLLPPVRRLREARDTLLGQRDAIAAEAARLTEANACLSAASEAAKSPFFHYHASFPAEDVIRRHAAADVRPDPARLTNFLGVRIDPDVHAPLLRGREGTVEPIPIPANWHADIAEWAAALRAVELARERFTMIELGCGWGCWMNNTGVAARRLGLSVHLIGVEADEGHIGLAREACRINGFAPEQVALHHGIAAAEAGVALFPRRARSGEHWGLEPVFGATPEQQAEAVRAGTHDALRMIPLAELAAPHPLIDLLHIDIQGGEADLVAGCRDVLCDKIAYVVIGTHARQIEGRLFDALLAAGWVLEIERPAILTLDASGPQVTVDGVQGWRNPRLART